MIISIASGIKIYNKLPLSIQNLIGIILHPIPIRYRGHKKVFKIVNLLVKDNEYRKDRGKLLRNMIAHAHRNVPFYKEIIGSLEININNSMKIEDIINLPIITKETIRNNEKKMIADNFKDFYPGKVKTSGSTGVPLEFYIDQDTRIFEYASEWRVVVENGGILGSRTATFRGNHYKGNTKIGPHWFTHALSGELNFNTYSMGPDACKKYENKLRRYKPEIYRAFPSSLSHLAKNISGEMISPNGIAFCSSEMIDEQIRHDIKQTICPKIINWYSQSEYVVSAGECSQGNMHINLEFGILEVVDENDINVPDGEIGRLIGTSLTNFSQPFIRYDLEDMGSIEDIKCACGNKNKILKQISGRRADMLKLLDGRMISTAMMVHWWKHYAVEKWDLDIFDWIQFIQTTKNKVIINCIPKDQMEVKQDLIEVALSELWGGEIILVVNIINELPQGEKWRFCKNEL